MTRTVKLCLMGFGNVGQAFVHLAERKKDQLEKDYGVNFIVTAIATGRHGRAIDPQGIDTDKAIALVQKGQSLDSLSKERSPRDIREFIAKSQADFLLENSPVSYKDGEPAITHIRTAFENNMHAVSANKGPVAHAWQELSDLAKSRGKMFLFESTVMDGAPVFSVVRESMLSAQILGFEGILNSCTNLIIGLMEEGYTFDEAVEEAQSIGITETDPSGDIDGWDAAIKVALLATVLMGEPITPQQVAREGIRDLSATEAQQALKDGGRWKLVCRAEAEDGIFTARVAPEIVPPTSPLYSVNGTSSIVIFHTDVLPGLGILESNPGPDTTAFGLLADILSIFKKRKIMAQDVFIGTGSNLGDRSKALGSAAAQLEPKARVLKASRIYETPPWGYEDQPAFLNQVLQVETELDPPALLRLLKRIEKKLGRQATFRYGPRAIDLDILFYDNLIYSTDSLQIPHPMASERAFVLVPMLEIAPDFVHPILGKTIKELARKVDSSGITIYKEGTDD